MEDQGAPMSFVIRLQRTAGGLRGHVIAVATGQGQVFTDLAEATAFIEAQMQKAPPGGHARRSPSEPQAGDGS